MGATDAGIVAGCSLAVVSHVVAFPVPRESSTCVHSLSTFLLSWSGAVSGASISFVRKLVYWAATLLAALGGFALGSCTCRYGSSKAAVRLSLGWVQRS